MIKQKLANRRLEKKLSQEKMGDLLGIMQSQYTRRETDQTIEKEQQIANM